MYLYVISTRYNTCVECVHLHIIVYRLSVHVSSAGEFPRNGVGRGEKKCQRRRALAPRDRFAKAWPPVFASGARKSSPTHEARKKSKDRIIEKKHNQSKRAREKTKTIVKRFRKKFVKSARVNR